MIPLAFLPDQTLNERVGEIIDYLESSLDNPYHGSSSMTCSIYDTAWLAMLSKPNSSNTGRHWLFPICFETVLNSQTPHGSFGGHPALVDGIMNTMAALLALQIHSRNPSITGCPPTPGIADRIARGTRFLTGALETWDVSSTDHVGFEILVPKLLDLLRRENLIIKDFPGHKILMDMNKRKLARFTPKMLYVPRKTTLVHSLEAFVDVIDFDRVKHHLSNGSMMNSPSATAAYLMNCSQWDEQAEAYLRFVVETRHGLVPSAFPITIFEISWVLSTVFDAGFTIDQLGKEAITRLADFLESQLQMNKGVTGFAPTVLADADDTAKSLYLLHAIGRPVDCGPMIAAFESETHFKTYDLEVTHSFSANCNVLKALLGSGQIERYASQISKALKYLCQVWQQDGELHDKWNLNAQYSMMLLTEALTLALKLWDNHDILDLPALGLKHIVTEEIPVVALEILIKTLSRQQSDGSWSSSREVTAYALLTIKRLASLFRASELEALVQSAVARGTAYLCNTDNEWDQPAFIWVEKTTYGSSVLARAYCAAALRADSKAKWGEKVINVFNMLSSKELGPLVAMLNGNRESRFESLDGHNWPGQITLHAFPTLPTEKV